MIVEFIDAHRDEQGVEPICAQLQIAPSTYYAHRTRPPPARSVTDEATTTLIEQVHAENFGVYGARKIHAQLHRQGHPVARCTVERLMRTAGLRGITRAKGPRTTIPGNGPDTRPDLVERAFTATGPDQLWVADITYCRIGPRSLVNRGCFVDASAPVTIGADVAVGSDVSIIISQHVYDDSHRRGGPRSLSPVIIADGAWLSTRAIILPGVTVGEGAVVGAGAVVTQDVQPHTLVVGVPATALKHLPS